MKELFALCLIGLLVLAGCADIALERGEDLETTGAEEIVEKPEVGKATEEEIVKKETAEEPEEVKPLEEAKVCATNSDCDQGEICIDGQCGTTAELYKTECEEECSIKETTIITSDGEELTLKPSRGSYTAAGGLDWEVMAYHYCVGEEPRVPISITRKSYGKILSSEVITLKEGETSKVITHPTISLEFTLTVKSVDVGCP